MTKNDKLILMKLQQKIKSGECTLFNYPKYVTALFYAYHYRSIERLFLSDLADKISSGICTPDNIFLFVDADFYQRKKKYIKEYFWFKKQKDLLRSDFSEISN